MIKLGVNIDHVATIRQARKTFEPDPVTAASLAILGGADIITVHLREDRRHIQVFSSDGDRLFDLVFNHIRRFPHSISRQNFPIFYHIFNRVNHILRASQMYGNLLKVLFQYSDAFRDRNSQANHLRQITGMPVDSV